MFRVLVFSAVVLLGVFSRFLPLPPNFGPMFALALFGGFYFRSQEKAGLLPLSIMLVSDLIIGVHALMPLVYANILLMVYLGRKMDSGRKSAQILNYSLLFSVVFFFSSNTMVWAMYDMYPKTVAGLGASLMAGIPFFFNHLAGNVVFAGMLFGLHALSVKKLPALQKAA